MNSNNTQVASDFASFSAPPPEQVAAQAKEREKQQKKREVGPDQIKAAKELAESVKAQYEAEEKAFLIRKLMDYYSLIKEFHPERVDYLKVPKNFGVKNTCEELRIFIDDIKAELGKKSGLDTMKVLWTEGARAFEKLNANERFGLKMDGLTQAALNSVASRRLEDGEIIPGPAVPTLKEFAVEHSNWFQSSVNWRICMMAAELIAGVHRMNSIVPAAQKAPVSKESADLMKDL